MSKETLEDLIAKSKSMDKAINAMKQDKFNFDEVIAHRTCPFKVGDRIRTASGLGLKNGLVVSVVYPPNDPHDGNRWAMMCFALTKDGGISARKVTLEEFQSEFEKPTKMEA